MPQDFENPFVNVGRIVSGPYFIGRRSSLQAIESRVIHPNINSNNSGSIAIIGIQRIGKSSLVYEALMRKKNQLTSNKVLPIWIDLALHENTESFFRSLVILCQDELEDQGWLTESVQRAASRVLMGKFSWGTSYYDIQRFFLRVRSEGIRIIFVLDEFDHACELFMGNTAQFQGIRELSYQPDWHVDWILIAYRTIREIELRTNAISNLGGILIEHYLGMFNEDELPAYFQRLERAGITVTPELRKDIDFHCGRHPYLLELVGYHLVELHHLQESVNMLTAFSKVSSSFNDYAAWMIDLLKELDEGELLNKLLQILFGPVLDVKQSDVDQLLSYGLIIPNSEWTLDQHESKAAYLAYSGYFQYYLSLIAQKTHIWPILGETERILRDLIAIELQSKYGEGWPTKLSSQNFQKWDETRKNAKRIWKDKAPDNILSYAYLRELFEVMFVLDWKDVFEPVFRKDRKKDKRYWNECADHLAKVRNPLAHNYAEVVSASDREKALKYCEDILELVRPHLDSKSPNIQTH